MDEENKDNPNPKTKRIKVALKRGKRYGQGALIIIFVLGVFLGVHLKVIYDQAQIIRVQALDIPSLLLDRDFAESEVVLDNINNSFAKSQSYFNRISIFKKLPWAGKQIKGAEGLVVAGALAANAAKDSAELLADTPYAQADDITLEEIDYTSREFILAKIEESPEKIQAIKANIKEARVRLKQVLEEPGVLSVITKNAKLLDDKLALAEAVLDKAEPLLKVVPELTGFGTEKNYLFLLLNNDELRPTGGFVSAYSVLNIKNSTIKDLELDDTYNLDKKFIGLLNNQAPAPIAKYNYNHPWYPNQTGEWFFRDVTWSPDFTEVAPLAMEFYLRESPNPNQKIDGVIAITPTFVGDLLTLSGNLEVREYFLASNNLADILEYESHIGHKQAGLPTSERKKLILRSLAQMFNNIFDLENSDWPKFLNIFLDNLNQKQIMVYSSTPEIQNELLELSWAGQIKSTKNDYLLVVDANLASLKTNRVIKRTIEYQISPAGEDRYNAKVNITYKHTGEPSYKITKYGTYTRVYVPLGSDFREAEGSEDKVDQGVSFGKQWFGTYINIGFGEEKTLSFEYELPTSITEKIKKHEYHLLAQKQAGTVNDYLKLNLDFAKQVSKAKPADDTCVRSEECTLYIQDHKFDTDLEFLVELNRKPLFIN
ncbi:DUF4012 domain-containing protein [Candidatus Falkowbacteria bacterium]|nr:DUF4012 domain-containing protein [Candidatus Falkowbacteria bacterium]